MPCDFVYFQGCLESPEVLLARIANMSLSSPPATRPSYSNLGFALLGRALGVQAGVSWEEYVQDIASALGMTNTGDDIEAEVCSQPLSHIFRSSFLDLNGF